jgi:hypothetical protein
MEHEARSPLQRKASRRNVRQHIAAQGAPSHKEPRLASRPCQCATMRPCCCAHAAPTSLIRQSRGRPLRAGLACAFPPRKIPRAMSRGNRPGSQPPHLSLPRADSERDSEGVPPQPRALSPFRTAIVLPRGGTRGGPASALAGHSESRPAGCQTARVCDTINSADHVGPAEDPELLLAYSESGLRVPPRSPRRTETLHNARSRCMSLYQVGGRCTGRAEFKMYVSSQGCLIPLGTVRSIRAF